MATEQDDAAWEVEIADWMSDTSHLFVKHHIEHAALMIYTRQYELAMRVPNLGVELATLATQR